jgi:uncharacterized protein DUF2092
MDIRLVSLRFACGRGSTVALLEPGVSAETAAPVSAASPASPQAPQATLPPNIDSRADQLLGRSCDDLGSSKAFTFHAEITFDQVLPSNVKLQFAAAAEYAVQRPDQLAVEFHSDLGGKQIWSRRLNRGLPQSRRTCVARGRTRHHTLPTSEA